MTTRRYELDWLRIIVFALLIFYHVSMYFNPWWWHIKSPEVYDWTKYPLMMLNQWRLEILFIISGMGTYFSLKKRNSVQYSGERLWRLGVPLIFGMLVIVPPQVYIERIVNDGLDINYWEYITTIAFQGAYPEGNITWNHLWFLPYLLCYSLLLVPFLAYFKGADFLQLLDRLKARLSQNPWNIYLFILPILVIETTLSPFFPVVPKLIGDWYAFTHYFVLFLFGFIFMHMRAAFFETCNSLKRRAMILAVLAFGGQLICFPYMQYTVADVLQSFLEIVYLWSVIIAIFGFATQYLSFNSKYLGYMNTAVYPFYIFHQTVLIIGIYCFRSYFTSDIWFFLFLIVLTFLGSWILFEGVRRVNILRPFLGLKGKYKTIQKKANLQITMEPNNTATI